MSRTLSRWAFCAPLLVLMPSVRCPEAPCPALLSFARSPLWGASPLPLLSRQPVGCSPELLPDSPLCSSAQRCAQCRACSASVRSVCHCRPVFARPPAPLAFEAALMPSRTPFPSLNPPCRSSLSRQLWRCRNPWLCAWSACKRCPACVVLPEGHAAPCSIGAGPTAR